MDTMEGMDCRFKALMRAAQPTTSVVAGSYRGTFCTASQLQGKWRVAILFVLNSGPVRLGELSRVLPQASKKMLMEELKSLVATGLVSRRDLTGKSAVRHVEYSLAKPIEAATSHLLEQLEEWNRAAQLLANGLCANLPSQARPAVND